MLLTAPYICYTYHSSTAGKSPVFACRICTAVATRSFSPTGLNMKLYRHHNSTVPPLTWPHAALHAAALPVATRQLHHTSTATTSSSTLLLPTTLLLLLLQVRSPTPAF
jgi:hypothetical protein